MTFLQGAGSDSNNRKLAEMFNLKDASPPSSRSGRRVTGAHRQRMREIRPTSTARGAEGPVSLAWLAFSLDKDFTVWRLRCELVHPGRASELLCTGFSPHPLSYLRVHPFCVRWQLRGTQEAHFSTSRLEPNAYRGSRCQSHDNTTAARSSGL